jgi:hypothetical protein
MNSFLQPIVDELLTLELGIQMAVAENMKKCIRFFLIAAVFDKPAKSAVLNMIASHGFNRCLKFEQSGESYTTLKGTSLY